MPESESRGSARPAAEDDSSGRLWRNLKALFFGSAQDTSLRAQLEEAINEHEHDCSAGEAPRNGDLSSVEREMLRNLLHFSEHDADDVAVPRSDIISISKDSSFDELVALFAEHGHSRIPVFEGELDKIIGMVHIKDVFAIIADDCDHPEDWSALIRQPLFVPEKMGALDLLAEMRLHRTHLAIVVDEYSGTEGLVTIEDLVEEIVGDIEDEHDDAPEALMVQLDDGSWEADARAELDDVGRTIDPLLAQIEEDVDTLGGLAFVLAEEVPEQGRVLEHDSGWKLEVLAAEDRRVTRLRLYPPPEAMTSP